MVIEEPAYALVTPGGRRRAGHAAGQRRGIRVARAHPRLQRVFRRLGQELALPITSSESLVSLELLELRPRRRRLCRRRCFRPDRRLLLLLRLRLRLLRLRLLRCFLRLDFREPERDRDRFPRGLLSRRPLSRPSRRCSPSPAPSPESSSLRAEVSRSLPSPPIACLRSDEVRYDLSSEDFGLVIWTSLLGAF